MIWLLFSLIWFASYDCSNDQIESTIITVSAVGRVAQFGDLYDARLDRFTGHHIWKDRVPNETVLTDNNLGNTVFDNSDQSIDRLEKRFDNLDITPDVRMSIMSGLIAGTAPEVKYLTATKTCYKSVKITLLHSEKTARVEIFPSHTKVNEQINPSYDRSNATHVVVVVNWGWNHFLSFEDLNSESIISPEIRAEEMETELRGLYHKIRSGNVEPKAIQQWRDKMSKYKFDTFGDMNITNTASVVDVLIEVNQTWHQMGKGMPQSYVMWPIQSLDRMIKINPNEPYPNVVEQDEFVAEKTAALLDKSVELKLEVIGKISYYENLVNNEKTYKKNMAQGEFERLFPKWIKRLEDMRQLSDELDINHLELRKELSDRLVKVRSGQLGDNAIDQLIDEYEKKLDDYDNKFRQIRRS